MGKYVLKKCKTGFNFNLCAGNNQVIGTSEVYSGKPAAKAGIKSVGNAASKAVIEDQTVEGFKVEKKPKFEIYKDKKGEFRFRLVASNGENILASEGYVRKASCKNGIASVIKNAGGEVVELDVE